MSNYRYPRKCYNILFQLDEVGRKTWVTCIRVLLYFYVFSSAWKAQSVGDIRTITAILYNSILFYIQFYTKTMMEGTPQKKKIFSFWFYFSSNTKQL